MTTFQVCFHRFFVELIGFTFDNGQSVGGTFADAGPQPVTEIVGNNLGLAVDDIEGPFSAAGDALAAAVA